MTSMGPLYSLVGSSTIDLASTNTNSNSNNKSQTVHCLFYFKLHWLYNNKDCLLQDYNCVYMNYMITTSGWIDCRGASSKWSSLVIWNSTEIEV